MPKAENSGASPVRRSPGSRMRSATPVPAYKKAWFRSTNFRRAISAAITPFAFQPGDEHDPRGQGGSSKAPQFQRGFGETQDTIRGGRPKPAGRPNGEGPEHAS